VKVVTLSGATHFAHLDRPERGRQTLVDALEAFLLKSPQ
jgi:pimeloyl-ACP methyl ester carboxylesterase